MDGTTLDQSIERQLVALEAAWPEELPLRWSPRSSFDSMVAHLLPAFPEVTSRDAETLGRFCRLYAGSILLHDRLLDGDFRLDEAATSAMRIVAMQYEAHRALDHLFGPNAVFWSRFRDYLVAYARAFVTELSFRRGRPPAELTSELGLSVAIAKHGVAKTIVAALVELTGREDLLVPLCDSVDAVAVAFQMRDDLEDWRFDLWTKTPSILLARLPNDLWEGPRDGDRHPFEKRVAHELYRKGHAVYVLRLARDRLRHVRLETLPPMPWTQMIAGLAARLDRMLATLDEVRGSSRPETR